MNARTRAAALSVVATLATATCVAPLFRGLDWFAPTAVGVVAVGLGGELARRLHLPSVFGPLLSAGLGLVAVTGMFARQGAYAGLFPTSVSFTRLHQLSHTGFQQISQLLPPVPTSRGLVLVTVVGVAAVALVVDLFAVTARRPAWAGLPLLGMFGVATALSTHHSEVLPFAIGCAGYLLLLLSEGRERILRWGRSVGSLPADESGLNRDVPGRAATAAAGRRVGAVALLVAVAVPLALPPLHSRLVGRHGGGGGGGSGGQSVTTFNPLVRLQQELTGRTNTPVLIYRTNSIQPDYLRLTALDLFDGDTWSSSPLTSGVAGRVSGGRPIDDVSSTFLAPTFATTQVQIRSLDVHWLPVPVVPLHVQVAGDWRFDVPTATVFSASDSTAGHTYTVKSTAPAVTGATVDEAAVGAPPGPALDTALPATVGADIHQLALSIVGTDTSQLARAEDLQNYFVTSGRFRYSLRAPNDDGVKALHTFLFVSHAGFCVQFSAAMAVLARSLAIPARVAVGFTPGVRQADGSYLVTAADAHAWPELYFSGVGWLRFEPTPPAAWPAQGVPPAYAVPPGRNSGGATGPGNTGGSTTARAGGPGGKTRWLTLHEQPTPVLPLPAPPARLRSAGPDWAPAVLTLVLVVVTLVLAGPVAVAWWRRRRRWAAARAGADRGVHAAWADLQDRVLDLGLPWRSSDTPRSAGRRLAAAVQLDPTTAAALQRLARAEELARYAPRPPADPGPVRADLLRVFRALAVGRSWRRRAQARLYPPSALVVIRATAVQWADRVTGFTERFQPTEGWSARRAGTPATSDR